MSRRLWPLVAHHADEPATSLVSRLAALHRRPPRQFCRDMALDHQGIVDGRRAALEALGDLVRVPVPALVDATFEKVADDAWVWRGETLRRHSLCRATTHVCPSCIAADLAAAPQPNAMAGHGRTIWTIDAVRACPVHRVALVPIGSATSPGELHDFARTLKTWMRKVPDPGAVARPVAPSDLEAYVLSRLSPGQGGAGVGVLGATAWLDALPLHAAVDACRTMGAVALHGCEVRMFDLDPAAERWAGDAGFAVASGGAEGVRAMLKALDASYEGSRGSTDGPQARYGALHVRLATTIADGGLEPLRDVVFEHVVGTTPVGLGDVILGRTVEGRRLHSIRSASLAHDVHPKRLRKILKAMGVIGEESDGKTDERTTFPATANEKLLAKAAGALSLTEVQEYLGADRVQAKLLMDEGLILPFVEIPALKASEKNFARGDLDGFLERMLAGADAVGTAPEGTYGIAAAAKRANCGAGEIVRLALDGRLSWKGRLAGTTGYGSILVELAEIKRLVHGAPLDKLIPRDVEKRLGARTKTVAALLENGHIPATVVRHPVKRCPTRVIDPTDVATFEATYVSLMRLADERAIHFRQLSKSLDAAGVRPALESKVYHATFYRRADVAAGLANI